MVFITSSLSSIGIEFFQCTGTYWGRMACRNCATRVRSGSITHRRGTARCYVGWRLTEPWVKAGVGIPSVQWGRYKEIRQLPTDIWNSWSHLLLFTKSCWQLEQSVCELPDSDVLLLLFEELNSVFMSETTLPNILSVTPLVILPVTLFVI